MGEAMSRFVGGFFVLFINLLAAASPAPAQAGFWDDVGAPDQPARQEKETEEEEEEEGRGGRLLDAVIDRVAGGGGKSTFGWIFTGLMLGIMLSIHRGPIAFLPKGGG